MSSIFAVSQNYTPDYFNRKIEKYDQQLSQISPRIKRAKKSSETLTQNILGGVLGGAGLLFDRSLQAIAIPGSYLAFQFVHHGFEFAAGCVDVAFSARDKVNFEQWSKRTKTLPAKEIFSRLELYKKEAVETQFKEWSKTLLEEEALTPEKKLKMFQAKGVELEALTQKKDKEALDAFRAVLDIRKSPEYQAAIKAYSAQLQKNDTIAKCLFQPVRALINQKQEQLSALFNWGLVRSIIRLSWSGTLSAVLLSMQVAAVAAGIIFPPAAVGAFVGAIILGILSTVVGSICLSAKRMPNTYRLHFSGLTTKLALDKIKRSCVKVRNSFKIHKLTQAAVASGNTLTHLNRLASNLAQAYIIEPNKAKHAELEVMLVQINEKINQAKQKWKKDNQELNNVLGRTQKYDSVINRREKALKQAQMADFMEHINPNRAYYKTPVTKKELKQVVATLDPQGVSAEGQALLQEETVAIRALLAFMTRGDLSQPSIQAFLKKRVFKDLEEEVTADHLIGYLEGASDPLKLKALAKAIVEQDPNLEGEQAYQLFAIGFNLDMETFRDSKTSAEKEKALTKTIKKYLRLNKGEMKEHYRIQTKKK